MCTKERQVWGGRTTRRGTATRRAANVKFSLSWCRFVSSPNKSIKTFDFMFLFSSSCKSRPQRVLGNCNSGMSSLQSCQFEGKEWRLLLLQEINSTGRWLGVISRVTTLCDFPKINCLTTSRTDLFMSPVTGKHARDRTINHSGEYSRIATFQLDLWQENRCETFMFH